MTSVNDDEHDPKRVNSIFVQFQSGPAKGIADSDSATHFDLGVAYAAMGLLKDAIVEFEIVLRFNPAHPKARAALLEARARLGETPSKPPPAA